MANGILKDEVTYYEDSEKYTGDSGSSTNMYVIEDTYDLMKALQPTQTGAVDYYLRLVNDIDFNDHSTYKKGFTGAVYEDARYHLYGDNHKIKNIVAMNATTNIFKFQYIENVDFVNLVSINCNNTIFIIKTVGTANNCDFGIFFSNGRFWLDSGTYNDCTFNMKGKVSQRDFIRAQTTSFNRCHFNFDISSHMRISSASGSEAGFIYGSSSSSQKSSFTNCYFTGKLKDSSAYTPILAPSYITLTGCYFAFEYTGGKALSAGNATYSTCFIDKELFEKNGLTWSATANGLSSLTTVQAQDSDYLNSIGFAVVPVE